MDWDDFKFFSAVVRSGTVRAAAKALGVHPSTVTRRLEHLETRLGVKLFNRRGQGLVLTAAGESAAAGLRRIEQDIAGIELLLRRSEGELAGPVRVVVPGFLLLGGLVDDLDRFVNAYGEIQIEWMSSFSPSASPAAPFDAALELTAAPALDLIGREIGAVGWSLYGHRGLLVDSGSALKWIEADGLACGKTAALAIDRLKSSHLDGTPMVARCQGFTHLLPLLRAGVGVSALPCLIGDADGELKRLPGAGVERAPLWLLRAPESRGTRRVQVFVDYLQAAVRAKAVRLRGG
ncbi:MAG: LysR family transcriptional regulator [Gammaproteobacteria bacterium]|nr:LysR family transcriptional regulator [Gammaproteobacteria bacterium]